MTGIIQVIQTHAALRERLDERELLDALPLDNRLLPRETLRLEVGRSDEGPEQLDWGALHRAQRAWVEGVAVPMLDRLPGYSIAWFGATRIPLALDLGQQLARWRRATPYQRHHREHHWRWREGAATVAVSSHGLPTDRVAAPGDVVLRVSTSFVVTAADTRAVLPHTLSEIDILTEPIDEDALTTFADVEAVVESFRGALNRLHTLRPAATIHLFLAVPMALAFQLGQAIHPNVHPPIQTWQFCAQSTPRYRRALVLGAAPPPEASMQPIRILFLAADPRTSPRALRSGAEHRDIRQRLAEGKHRDRFEFEEDFAVRRKDLIAKLDRKKAEIVHFSGHGTADGRLVLEGPNDEPKELAPEAVCELFEIVNEDRHLRLLVLNACFSDALASELVRRHVLPAAIGMTDAISDPGAIVFAEELYRALADGQTVKGAFDRARAQLKIEGHRADYAIVRLYIADDAAPALLTFAT
ncbi:MAG: SAVED domain-containing protein [Pseudomonadota bacterium]|nr:SAVED domain-containing protein [Pseudomonadota bacterium]